MKGYEQKHFSKYREHINKANRVNFDFNITPNLDKNEVSFCSNVCLRFTRLKNATRATFHCFCTLQLSSSSTVNGAKVCSVFSETDEHESVNVCCCMHRVSSEIKCPVSCTERLMLSIV